MIHMSINDIIHAPIVLHTGSLSSEYQCIMILEGLWCFGQYHNLSELYQSEYLTLDLYFRVALIFYIIGILN